MEPGRSCEIFRMAFWTARQSSQLQGSQFSLGGPIGTNSAFLRLRWRSKIPSRIARDLFKAPSLSGCKQCVLGHSPQTPLGSPVVQNSYNSVGKNNRPNRRLISSAPFRSDLEKFGLGQSSISMTELAPTHHLCILFGRLALRTSPVGPICREVCGGLPIAPRAIGGRGIRPSCLAL